MHVGWLDLHSDASLNFQLNRWLAYGGEHWLADVLQVLDRLSGYDAWRNTFVELGNRAEAEGRFLDAALHLRAGEFFMESSDPRKTATRRRLTALLRHEYGVTPAERHDVAYAGGMLPAFHFSATAPRSTIRRLRRLRQLHRRILVTLFGSSLGGCLAIRAAALEPRVARVIAFDAMTDFFACMLGQLPRAGSWAMQSLVHMHARWIVNRVAEAVARRRPVVGWGLRQAMHVFGCATPFDVFAAARAFGTDDVSHLLNQDIPLLAGAEDHYVSLDQLWDQARTLTKTRSITCRFFTEAEDAQAHCQVGNLPLAISTMAGWLEMRLSADSPLAPVECQSECPRNPEAQDQPLEI